MSDPDRQWAKAGRAARARSEAVRRPLRAAVAHDVRQGLEGVAFASKVARQRALEAGLGWPAFEGREGTGKDGGFTSADVEKISRGLFKEALES